MEKYRVDTLIAGYMKKLFGFAVSRLSNIAEAEEFSSELVLQVYEALLKAEDITNTDGYVWRIAKNCYARHISAKKQFTAVDGIEYIPDSRDITQELIDEESKGLLRREITYLGKTQREIIMLHYFKDKKVREIAKIMQIPENTVKWHLACSRKELKDGMEKVRTTGTLGTHPIVLIDMGHSGCSGDKGDTSDFLAKSITQNIAYAAYHQPRTINEIAEELGINPIFVEDEVAVLEEYAFIDKLPDGRYRTNIEIYEPCEYTYKLGVKLKSQYSKLFAEKFFAPVLESIKEIPDFVKVPDNDLNCYKWAVTCFLANQLGTAELDGWKYTVKRPDGGDFRAFATVAVEPDWDVDPSLNIYWSCGDMTRDEMNDKVWWKSWQLDCAWAGRSKGWRDNWSSDYTKLFYFMKGELPETTFNADSYQRLLDKGYLLKENGGYKINMIICDSEKKWHESIPCAPEEILDLSREYAEKILEGTLYNQPEHMHEQLKYFNQNSAVNLRTWIMKQLIDMGVLKHATPEQRKGLCTVMFLGE